MQWNIISLIFGAIGGFLIGTISTYVMLKGYLSRPRIEFVGIGKTTGVGTTVTVGDVSEEEKRRTAIQEGFFNEYENLTTYYSVLRKKGKGLVREIIANRYFDPPISDSKRGIARDKDSLSISGPKIIFEVPLFSTGEKNGKEYLLVPITERAPYEEKVRIKGGTNSLPTLYGMPVLRVGKFEVWKDNEVLLVVSGEGVEGVNLTKTFGELKKDAEWLGSTRTKAIGEK